MGARYIVVTLVQTRLDRWSCGAGLGPYIAVIRGGARLRLLVRPLLPSPLFPISTTCCNTRPLGAAVLFARQRSPVVPAASGAVGKTDGNLGAKS